MRKLVALDLIWHNACLNLLGLNNLTQRGHFSPLDGPTKNSYTGSVKGCADGPRPRITDGTGWKREQRFIRQSGPRRYGCGRISATGNCVWAVREVSFSTAENPFAVEVEPQVRGDASPAYVPAGQLQV